MHERTRLVMPLTQAADFERVLKAPTSGRSPHFAVHHLAARPFRRPRTPAGAVVPELSTGSAPEAGAPVDDLAAAAPGGLWLGTVVPKRHARRAVTRSLMKRQIRAAVHRHAHRLPDGLWVVRLRLPFDRAQYPSAASEALRRVVRAELDAMFGALRPR